MAVGKIIGTKAVTVCHRGSFFNLKDVIFFPQIFPLKVFIITTLLLCLALDLTAQKTPLKVPETFNAELNLIGSRANGEVFHRVYENAQFVAKLLENGTPQDIALAEEIIPALLLSQDTTPSSPTYGAFKWELETPMVDDLNAVEFLLDGLVPMMIKDGHKLSPKTAKRLRSSIRLALHNVNQVDVGFKYTNIILKDIANSSLGGELLGDTAIAHRGYRRLREWMAFTDAQGGGAYEFNALPYTAVALDVLSKLSKLTTDHDTKVLANMMLARLGLSAALHTHEPTGRWAGPHGRAYHNSYISAGGWYIMDEKERETLINWVKEGKLPDWLDAVMEQNVLPDQIIETTGKAEGIDISTYKTEDYAFGIASRNMSNQDNRFIAWQSNVFSLVYTKPESLLPGVFYSRYIVNDEWLGDFSAGPGRPTNMLIPDVGNFQGVQDQNRAISLYAPRTMGALEHYTSAKSVIALPRWEGTRDKIYINGELVKSLPANVPQGEVVVIESGELYMAFLPFTLTDLGMGKHMELRRMNDQDSTLVFEMYNYQGPAKTFWQLAWPGTFFQGWPRNGWYTEIASQKDYKDALAFTEEVKRGQVIDKAAPPFTYSGTEERKWRVEYERDGRKLGLEVDLFDWQSPTKRWDQKGDLGWPMLQSKRAIQDKSGRIQIGEIVLEAAKENSSWLYVSPDEKTIVAAYHGPTKAPVLLKVPNGSVKLTDTRQALIIVQNESVRIEAIGATKPPEVQGLKLFK